jgi:hypothetical protein
MLPGGRRNNNQADSRGPHLYVALEGAREGGAGVVAPQARPVVRVVPREGQEGLELRS